MAAFSGLPNNLSPVVFVRVVWLFEPGSLKSKLAENSLCHFIKPVFSLESILPQEERLAPTVLVMVTPCSLWLMRAVTLPTSML